MPFRTLQKFEKFQSGKIVYTYLQTNPDTGISEPTDVDQCASLPSVEMTDLGAELKAGVNLKEVNCKLVNGSNAVASLESALSKAAKKSASTQTTQPSNNGEKSASTQTAQPSNNGDN